MTRYYYAEETPSPDDLHVEGIVLLNDLEKFSDLEGCRVIVFQDTKKGEDAIAEIEETGELDIAFQAALAGDAEELSIAKLVKFYLANGM